MAGADKALESSLWSHNVSIAYPVKFFGPSGSLTVENKPNKVRTRFFRFSVVSRVPARRAISPAPNSLSLRALAGCYARSWPVLTTGRSPQFPADVSIRSPSCRAPNPRLANPRLRSWASFQEADCAESSSERSINSAELQGIYRAFPMTGGTRRNCGRTHGVAPTLRDYDSHYGSQA